MIQIKDIKLYPIEESLISSEILYAHVDDKNKLKKPELLIEHSKRTIDYFYKLSQLRGIDKVIDNIIDNFNLCGYPIGDDINCLMKELFVNAIYMHDMGKINPVFQFVKMANKKVNFKNSDDAADSRHSMLSAIIYLDTYTEKIQKITNRKIRRIMQCILFRFAYIISRHHTFLEDFGDTDFLGDMQNLQNMLNDHTIYLKYYRYPERLLNKLKINIFNRNLKEDYVDGFKLYTITRLLYSSIVTCDFYATYRYKTGKDPEFNYIDDVDKLINKYKNTEIYKGIEAYKKDKSYFGKNSINSLRSEMFLDSEKNLMKNIDESNIFYLEAPTGSGKTNTSINLALDIIKHSETINKITYVFPFNTLVEQTKSTLDKTFNVAVINSITPIITEKERNTENDEDEDKVDYKKDYLNRQMLEYPIVLTTHVNFFNYLFGTGREINLPFIHLCNSVVIIDEVQSYRNIIWPEIIKFLSCFSKLLNIKIIIMSATLPKLDRLLHNEECNFCELISDKNKYYQDELFRDRVKLNFELLSKDKTDKNELLDKIDEVIRSRDKARILIEFIKKTTSREMFNELKKRYPDKNIYEMTGDDSNYERKKILDIISKKNDDGSFSCSDVILVATQVIEAGIDIDMDIGFKDISLLDGEEQFLGRINRSCLKNNCEAYFFNLDRAEQVYKNDFRLEFDLRNKIYQEYLKNKYFEKFYQNCFKRLDEEKAQMNEKNIENFNMDVLELDYKKVCEHMELITEKNYQLFLAYKIKDEKTGDIILDGEKVWQKYKELIADNNMEYSKKKIELSFLAEKMAYFTYNYVDYSVKGDGRPKKYDDNIGRIYYLKNGCRYMTEDNKFDREEYQKDSGGLFA